MPLFPVARSFDALSLRYGTRYKWLAMLVVALGTIAGVLSTSSFNVAVPSLTRAFALGQEQVQWVMTGFMGAMTVSMLPAPWLLERLGFRKLFLGAVLALLVTSIAGYLAPTFPLVVAARIAQGIATGVLQPLGPLAVMRLFPPESQGRASGILAFGIVLVPAIAPAAGGALLDAFGWRTIFLLNLPFCVAAMVLALIFLPLPREIRRTPFDWSGVAMLTLATLVLVEAFSLWRQWQSGFSCAMPAAAKTRSSASACSTIGPSRWEQSFRSPTASAFSARPT
jgi:MFS family permease